MLIICVISVTDCARSIVPEVPERSCCSSDLGCWDVSYWLVADIFHLLFVFELHDFQASGFDFGSVLRHRDDAAGGNGQIGRSFGNGDGLVAIAQNFIAASRHDFSVLIQLSMDPARV